jgi:hypothetical protein
MKKTSDETHNMDPGVPNRSVARFQIELLADRMADVERMLHLTGIRTKRELFEHAFTVFQFALDQAAQGNRLGFQSADGKFEVLLYPPLENAYAYANKKNKTNGVASSKGPAPLQSRKEGP